MAYISVDECRTILGEAAVGHSDEQLQQLLDNLSRASAAFYDEIQDAWKRDPESVRWAVYAHQTGEME